MLWRVDHDPAYFDVKVNPEWRDFRSFLSEVGECPEGCSPERKNPFGGYCKENFQWIPAAQQSENKRNSKILRYDFRLGEGGPYPGAIGTVAQWARYLRGLTGNKIWTTKYLQTVFKAMTLDEIIGAVSPYFGAPEEFAIAHASAYGHMFEKLLTATYLEAA